MNWKRLLLVSLTACLLAGCDEEIVDNPPTPTPTPNPAEDISDGIDMNDGIFTPATPTPTPTPTPIPSPTPTPTPIPTAELTMDTTGNGSVNVTSGTVNVGTEVTVTATPAIGYIFSGWQVNGVVNAETGNVLTITITGDTLINANFTPE